MPYLLPGDFSDPEIETVSLASPALAGGFSMVEEPSISPSTPTSPHHSSSLCWASSKSDCSSNATGRGISNDTPPAAGEGAFSMQLNGVLWFLE